MTVLSQTQCDGEEIRVLVDGDMSLLWMNSHLFTKDLIEVEL